MGHGCRRQRTCLQHSTTDATTHSASSTQHTQHLACSSSLSFGSSSVCMHACMRLYAPAFDAAPACQVGGRAGWQQLGPGCKCQNPVDQHDVASPLRAAQRQQRHARQRSTAARPTQHGGRQSMPSTALHMLSTSHMPPPRFASVPNVRKGGGWQGRQAARPAPKKISQPSHHSRAL